MMSDETFYKQIGYPGCFVRLLVIVLVLLSLARPPENPNPAPSTEPVPTTQSEPEREKLPEEKTCDYNGNGRWDPGEPRPPLD